MPNTKAAKKTTIYKRFSEKESKALWIMAVCQNNSFLATRGITATVLDTDKKSISNLYTRIKKKNDGFIVREQLGLRVPAFISPPANAVEDIDKDQTGYSINIKRNVSTRDASRVVLAVEDLYNKSVFLNEAGTVDRLVKTLELQEIDVRRLLTFLLNTDYLEMHPEMDYVLVSESGRCQAEHYYLTLMADDPHPDFVSNIKIPVGGPDKSDG